MFLVSLVKKTKNSNAAYSSSPLFKRASLWSQMALFLPTPLSMLWCFSRGKFCFMSELSLPCCSYFFSLFATTFQGFQIVIRGFLSTRLRYEADGGAPEAGGTPRKRLCPGGPGLRPVCAEPPGPAHAQGLDLQLALRAGWRPSPFPSSDPGLLASFLDYAGSAGWALPGLGQQMASGKGTGDPLMRWTGSGQEQRGVTGSESQ